MKLRQGLLALISIALIAVSCQKEMSIDSLNAPPSGPGGPGGGGNNTSLTGTWKFVQLDARTESIVDATDGTDTERTISRSSYTTINNKGTITFDATKMTMTNLSYEVKDTVFAWLYGNNVLIDSFDAEFQVTLPATNGSSNYTLKGADSIYFSASVIVVPGTDPQPAQSSGAKYKIAGNILTWTAEADKTTTTNEQGVAIVNRQKVWAEYKFEKQ